MFIHDHPAGGSCGAFQQKSKVNVLVVDDEPDQLETIQRGLFLYGYSSTGVLSGHEAEKRLLKIRRESINVLVTDLTMPGRSGFELIETVRKKWPALPIVVITGLTITREVSDLRRQGIQILQKPFSPDQLDQAIKAITSK